MLTRRSSPPVQSQASLQTSTKAASPTTRQTAKAASPTTTQTAKTASPTTKQTAKSSAVTTQDETESTSTTLVPLSNNNVQAKLANASIGDSRHDFHEKFGNIRTWIRDHISIYNKSLPFAPSDPEAPYEDEILASVVALDDGYPNENYSPILEPKGNNSEGYFFDFGARNTSFRTIQTIRGQNYNVRRCQVKDLLNVSKGFTGKAKKTWSDKYIGAKKFTHDLNIETNSVFIIDAAAISFNTIMTNNDPPEKSRKSPQSEPRKTFYYIYASEVENDPAGKTRYDDKMFRSINANSPHSLISCIPSDSLINSNVNYTYKWNPESTDPYNNFFTKFNYQLSELYLDKKSKTQTYITNVKITDPMGKMATEPIINSGKANSIGSLAVLLEGVIKFFLKPSAAKIPQNEFSMNTSFLQKRSGDWLQVLLCLVIRNRKFKTYGTSPVIENIQDQFTDIYFVTHDRIAMAFALLVGVNVIYTHGDTQCAYSYKVLNPQQETARINALIELIKTKAVPGGELEQLKQQYLNYIDAYNSTIYTFVPDCNANGEIITACENLITDIDKTINQPSNHFSSTMVLNATRKIFTKAMQHCYLKVIFPNVETFRADITRFDIPKFLTRLQNIRLSSNDKNALINEYNDFMSKCRTVESLINTFIGPVGASGKTASTTFNIASTVNKLRVQPAYKAAETWTWDIGQGQRYYERLVQAVAGTNYKNDKNMFLYNLQNLDEQCKSNIAQAYGKLYIELPNITEIYAAQSGTQATSTVNRQKFNNVVQSFCVEVLMNCCPTPPDLNNGVSVDDIITKFIKKTIPLAKSPNPIGNNLSNDKNYYAFISEVNIINENEKVITNNANLINSVNIDAKIEEVADVPNTNEDDPAVIEQQGGEPIKIINVVRDSNSIQNFIIEQNPRQAIGPLLNMHLAHNIASAESFHLLQGWGTRRIATSGEIGSMLISGLSTISLGWLGRIFIMNQNDLQQYLESIQQEQTVRDQASDSERANIQPSAYNEIVSQVDPTLLPGGQEGGSSEKDSLSSEEEEIQDVLTDNSICFHPSLPIYMMANAYLSFAENDDIEQSLEYEFCIKYFKFLKECQKKLASSYANENNNKENKIKAYVIGMGLKQLFFTANVDEKEGPQKCHEALGMTESEYFPISNLSSTISYMSSGRILQSDEERTIGLRILESPIFTDYIRAVNPKQIFDEPLSSSEFVNRKMMIFKARSFIIDIGRKIIVDRTGQTSAAPEASELSVPISTTSTEPIPVEFGNDQAQGIAPPQKPFDYRTLDQGPRDAFGQASNFGAPISVGASGGKKKQRKTKYAKRANKTYKKCGNKKVGKRTRKHKKMHKKKFTRKHKK